MARVAVQLIVYKSAKSLPRVLDCLSKQQFKDWTLLVYDNSCAEAESRDMKNILEQSGLPFQLSVAKENVGFTAHNFMFLQSDAPYVLVLNDDVLLLPDYLEKLVAFMEAHPDCASSSGLIFRTKDVAVCDLQVAPDTLIDAAGLEYQSLARVTEKFAGRQYGSVQDKLTEPQAIFGVSGCAALYRRSAVLSSSPDGALFDPTFFMYKEDVELSLRLRKNNFSSFLVPLARGFHVRGVKTEARNALERIHEERSRNKINRLHSYRNQWLIYFYHFSSSLSLKDLFKSAIHEAERSSLVFVASPTLFMQAWKHILMRLPAALRKRKRLNILSGIAPIVIPAEAGIHERIGWTPASAGMTNRSSVPDLQQASLTNFPKIGLIYLTYPTKNAREDISRFLTSLHNINYPKDRIELICVESKGALPPVGPWFMESWLSKSRQELPRMIYVYKDKQLGFAANNNLGYEKALEQNCDFVMLVNEDADVDPDFLLAAVERALSDPRIAVVQPLLLLGQDRNKVNSIGNSLNYLGFGYSQGYLWDRERALLEIEKNRIADPDLNIDYASGAAMLIRMSTLQELGEIFDEKFFSYHEDTDVSLQLKIRGFKIVLEPKSVVYHYYEFGKSLINYYWMERNRYVILFSFYKLRTLLLLSPMIAVMDLGLLVFSTIGGWFEMKLKVYADFFRPDFWAWIAARRRRIKNARTISDRELLYRAAPTIEFQHTSVNNPLLKYVGNPLLAAYWRVIKNLI